MTVARTERTIDIAGLALVVLLAGALPLIVLPGAVADDTDILPKVLSTRLVVLALALLWAARCALSGSLRWRRTPLDHPVLALVLSASLSTALSVNTPLSLFGAYTRYEGLITICTYAALFWLAAQFVGEPQRARWLLRAMLAGAVIECVVALSQEIGASASGDLAVYGESATTFGGVARAIGTMANANNLAIWLAMLIPVGVYEAVDVRPVWGRLAAAGTTLLMVATLIVTFGRSAWIGAGLGLVVVCVLTVGRLRSRRRLVIGAGAVVVAAACCIGLGTVALRLEWPVIAPAYQRVLSLANPGSGSGGVRLHLYEDAVHVVAGRPLIGYGPDTFGLVSPSRSSGDWTHGIVVDKAHSDILQVAVTQGALGAAAYIWLLGAAAVMLTRSRDRRGIPAIAGAVVAYVAAISLNFAWFPVTAPFWLVLVAGVALGERTHLGRRPLRFNAAARAGGLATAVAVCALATAWSSVRPGLANAHYARALAHWSAGNRAAALTEVGSARADDPGMSEYAAFQGDLEADLAGDRPGPDANLTAARRAYETALGDGDIYPAVAIRLVFVDVALGDRAGALAAARAASALDPYGQAVKLIAELGG